MRVNMEFAEPVAARPTVRSRLASGVNMPIDMRLAALRVKIAAYGKENQGELLYALAEGARLCRGASGCGSTLKT